MVVLNQREVLVLRVALTHLRLLRVQVHHLLLLILHLGSRLGQNLSFLRRRLEVLLPRKTGAQSFLKSGDVAFNIFLHARGLKLAEEGAGDWQNNLLLVRLSALGLCIALDQFVEELEVVGK